MKTINLIGIDLAKETFQLHGVNEKGQPVLKKKLKRGEMLNFFCTLVPTTVAMEACGGSHYWARKLSELGHEVKIISANYVKPFVKSQKNDCNDAEAIVEAASRPSMHYVKPKEIWQQDLQVLHRVRTRLVSEQVALMNQTRGILLEYGITVREGVSAFRKAIPEIVETENDLTEAMREVILDLYEEYKEIQERKESYDKRIKCAAAKNEECQRLMKVPGVGVLSSTMFVSAVGDPGSFKNGRQVSAWLGLVPKQVSTGGRTKLLGITKRGDTYLRSLLIHGARAQILSCHKKAVKTSKDKALLELVEKKGYNKAAVALANRNARVMWSLLRMKTEYKTA